MSVESIWTCDICGKVEHNDWLGKPGDWYPITVKWGGYTRTGFGCRQCLVHYTPEQGLDTFWKQVLAFLYNKKEAGK